MSDRLSARIERLRSINAAQGYEANDRWVLQAYSYMPKTKKKAGDNSSSVIPNDARAMNPRLTAVSTPAAPVPVLLSFSQSTYTIKASTGATFYITMLYSNGIRIDITRTANVRIAFPEIAAILHDNEWVGLQPGETAVEASCNGLHASALIRVTP